MNASSRPAQSPAQLAEQIRRGQPEAEAALVERYARGVRIVLQRHTRTRVEAEDLFQDTFRLAVVKLRAGELRDSAKLSSFLSSLARNLATEHYRKAIRRKTEADSEAVETESDSGDGEQAQGSPLRDLLRNEEAQLVRRTLEDLPTERDREILFRFYLADEDKDTIAADHDLSSLQFNRVLHRARQRYKELYMERMRDLRPGSSQAHVLFLLLFASAWWHLFSLWMRSVAVSHH